MTIALAFSSAFMTPLSPANTLVATAGNYSFQISCALVCH
jgi:di/tricarboxylate transporter